MARATTTQAGGRDGGSRTPQPRPRGEGSYFAGVVSELRKVTWPSAPDLLRMTQVVIATVIIFAALIGGLDFVLGFVAKPLYTQQGTAAPTQSASFAPPTLKPLTSPSPSGGAASSGTTAATTSASVTGSGTTTP